MSLHAEEQDKKCPKCGKLIFLLTVPEGKYYTCLNCRWNEGDEKTQRCGDCEDCSCSTPDAG